MTVLRLFLIFFPFYFVPGTGAKYCVESVCLSVCLSIRSHNSKITQPNFTSFFTHVAYGCSSVPFGGIAICYVLPVRWMTSYFHIMALWRVMLIPCQGEPARAKYIYVRGLFVGKLLSIHTYQTDCLYLNH